MLSVNSDGFVLFLGIYQLFHLKIIAYYCLGGLGGLWSYLLYNTRKNIKITIKSVIFAFMSTILTIYLVIGALAYIFDVEQHAYLFFLAGYFSRDINIWIENHIEEIIDKLSKKLLSKTADVKIDGEKNKDDNQ